MRNPINILNDRISQATNIIELAVRSSIHSSRANKYSKIDLRKFKGNPDKKERIRKIILAESTKAIFILTQMMIVSSQPIRTKEFDRGGEVAIINKGL